MKIDRLSLFSLVLAALLSSPVMGEAVPEPEGRYRLQPSDVLEVHYRYTPEFNDIVTVQPDGDVSLKIVGDARVEGLTLEQAKAAILAKAVERLRDPEITLVLKEFARPYFVVGGEVRSPGRFEMHGTVNAIEAIAIAGGFKNSAKRSQVILVRKNTGHRAKTQILNLKADITSLASELNIDLQPGDTLIVPQNGVSKVQRVIPILAQP